MPIRNPFRRTPGAGVVDDAQADGKTSNDGGAKPLQIKEPPEYKLSGTSCTPDLPWWITTSPYVWRETLTACRDQ